MTRVGDFGGRCAAAARSAAAKTLPAGNPEGGWRDGLPRHAHSCRPHADQTPDTKLTIHIFLAEIFLAFHLFYHFITRCKTTRQKPAL